MKLFCSIFFYLVSSVALSQNPQLSPNAPEDKPAHMTAGQLAAFEKAIAPHVAKAKASYPAAKKKFLAGLPKRQHFFVTTRLRDERGVFEQVFIAVLSIKKGKVEGRIWSDIES
ncbi:MAG: hypothetical protein ACREO2_07945, partial [Arenimonas sp.]